MKVKMEENEIPIYVEQIIKSKIDVKGGKLTFGQRIELGKIFQTEDTEVRKFEKVFQLLHFYTPCPDDYSLLLDYFKEILDGLTFWIESETKLLKYEPSPEEIQAGIKDLSAKIGEFGTVKAIAKTYSKDPDEILKWEYGKIFGILYSDLEEYLFQKRLNKVIEQKHKK